MALMTRRAAPLALPLALCWALAASAFVVPPALRVCSRGTLGLKHLRGLPSAGSRAGCRAPPLAMAFEKKDGGGILDSAVSFFSNMAGIDYREADERPEVVVEEVVEGGPSEKEILRSQLKASQAAEVREGFEGLVAVLSAESLSEAEWRDCMNKSKQLVQSLVTWVPEGGPTLTTKGGNVTLSSVHIGGLNFVNQLQALAKQKDAKLSSSFKWIPKKLGLAPYISMVNRSIAPAFRSSRDMRLFCRDVERGVSEAVHLLATHAILDGPARADYAASCRAAMEHVVVRDRHASVMLHSAYFRLLDVASKPSLSDALKKFPSDFAYSTAPARAAFPFLEVPLRHWASTMKKDSGGSIGLLERISRADALGATCEGLQRWAVGEGLRGKIDREAARLAKVRSSELGETVLSRAISHQLMRELLGPFSDLYEANEAGLQQWRHSLVPLGAMVALLDGAKADDGSPLGGKDLIVACNAVMMLSALRSIHDPASDTYSEIAIGVNGCDEETLGRSWKLVVDGLVKGLAELLSLDAAGEGLRARVEDLLGSWRMPQLLLQVLELQADDEDMSQLLYTFLKTLLADDSEKKLREIRVNHPRNREHLSSLDQQVVKQWTERDDLPGTIDMQSIFMMGEDTRTCMAIHPVNTRTQKGLLGYLLQGNTRLLVAKPLTDEQSGRTKWRARAVARLLMRRDTKETVLFVDRAYYEGEEDSEAKEMLQQQARELADKVGVKLYMAQDSPPSEDEAAAFDVPSALGIYPFPAVELIENGGISPYVWRDGRYGIGLLMRGEGIITSVGGNSVVVAVLFGGWSDCMSTYEEKAVKKENRGTGTSMREVQEIGAAISNQVRGTRTLEKKKKKNPWDLTF